MTTTNHYQSLPGSGGATAKIATTTPCGLFRAQGFGSDCGVAHGVLEHVADGESLPTTTALPTTTKASDSTPVDGCITGPADGRWPWRVKRSKPGRRGEVYGPDGKYRCSMNLALAIALAEELNEIDPRVDGVAFRAWRAAKEASR